MKRVVVTGKNEAAIEKFCSLFIEKCSQEHTSIASNWFTNKLGKLNKILIELEDNEVEQFNEACKEAKVISVEDFY